MPPLLLAARLEFQSQMRSRFTPYLVKHYVARASVEVSISDEKPVHALHDIRASWGCPSPVSISDEKPVHALRQLVRGHAHELREFQSQMRSRFTPYRTLSRSSSLTPTVSISDEKPVHALRSLYFA